MPFGENFEGCPEAEAGRRDAWGVGRIHPAGVSCVSVRYLDLPLHVPSVRAGRAGIADQVNLPDARSLWVSACACSAASRWLAGERQAGEPALS